MIQLKHSDIPSIRAEYLLLQNNKCLLCKRVPNNPVLDHDHKTKVVRGVLCRGCNSLLGKIENNYKRFGLSRDRLDTFLHNILTYTSLNNDFKYLYPDKKKKKMTKKQIALKWMERIGAMNLKNTGRYEVFQLDGYNYYVGKRGAIRKGKSVKDSRPVSFSYLRTLV